MVSNNIRELTGAVKEANAISSNMRFKFIDQTIQFKCICMLLKH